MNLLVCLLVIIVTGTLVIKKFKAQTVLLLGGLIMMFAAYLLGYTTSFVDAKKTTGVLFFDAFEFINITTAKDAANLGLMIMTCTGFAKYMDHIGASSRLVVTAIKPLGKMKSAYLVMALTFILNMFMSLVIPSASGLAMLMMVTIFPILVRLGVSPVGAAAAVATGHLLDIGPASATTLLVSKTVNMPVHEYFVGYQLKVYIICGLMAAIAHFVWQKYLDKKSGHVPAEYVEAHKSDELEVGPLPYIFLPLLPLIFILGFSDYGIQGVKMNVNLAMFLSLFIAMGCELIRYRDFRKMADLPWNLILTRFRAKDLPSTVVVSLPCIMKARSKSSNTPSRAITSLPLAVSSAGVPYTTNVQGTCNVRFKAIAAVQIDGPCKL
jgi:C4-dicarboxylate transporter, DcuC family